MRYTGLMTRGTIRVGVGGWTYEPWRGVFYPKGLPHAREFEYAVNHLTAIEINATFYGRQKPASWEKWAKGAPQGFKFAIKASRYCVTRSKLAEAGEGIAQFLDQGLVALGDKLGPILWQFAGTRKYDHDDIAAFLALLPATHDGLPLHHAIEPRHESFRDPDFYALARQANAAIVFADDDTYPCIDAPAGGFTYARLQRTVDECSTGYDAAALDHWADRGRGWGAEGETYVFIISGAKHRNPAAAMAMIERLG